MSAPGRFNVRDRVLDTDELTRMWLAAGREPYPFGPILQLCILTGQRRGEVGQFRWEFFDERERICTLPAAICKNKVQHTFPYGQMVQDILNGLPRADGYLFPGRKYRQKKTDDPERSFGRWARGKENFDKRCPINAWTLHDLRRTFATIHAQIGTPIHVTERLLNHVSGTLGGIVGVYQKHTWMPEMRAAMAAYEAHIAKLMRPATRAAA